MTTANAPTPTIHLDGIGEVPALPEELHPVAAIAAVELPAGLPIGTWGVVAWPAGADTPTLVERNHQTVIAARRYADRIVTTWGTNRVYLVRRCPTAVTVHSLAYPNRGHLLGSLEADAGAYADAWNHAMCGVTGDPLRDGQHAQSLIAAWRRAHGLPAATSALDVVHAVTGSPLSPMEYLNAYCLVLAGNLHADAVTAHRAADQHVAPELVDDRVRQLGDQLRERYSRTA